MKKLLLSIVASLFTLTGVASEVKTFTDQLVVTVNESVTTQQTTVSVELLDDNYINFVLRNFVLEAEGDEMFVGNIEVNNLFLTDKGAYKTFTYNANLKIKDGDLEGVDMWIGPELGNVPLVLNGKLSDGKLYVSIDIDMMSSISQMIYVKFGSDFDTPAETGSHTYTAAVTSKMISMDEESYGVVVPLDDVESFDALVHTLSTGDVDLVLDCISLSSGGEGMTLGNLSLANVETTDRGSYSNLYWTGTAVFTDGVGADAPFTATLKGKMTDGELYYQLSVGPSELWTAVYEFTFGSDFAPVEAVGEAKEYDDKLVVTVDAESTEPMDARVLVTPLNNGGINFALKNFTMILNGNEMHVGNIEVPDLVLYPHGDYQYFNYNGILTIAAGDEAGVDEDEYIGPLLGNIPLRMRGRMNDERLNVIIDIDMEVGGMMQVIHVDFGSEITNAIAAVTATPSASGRIFDLSGRQVRQMRKGIYVVDGRKIVR